MTIATFVSGLALGAALFAPSTGTIRGIVVDTRDGTPIQHVAVRLHGTAEHVTTDEAGRFIFKEIAAGDHQLLVSAVDFILVTRSVHVRADAVTELTIALVEGVGTYSERVDVRGSPDANPGGRRDAAVAATQTLTGRELQSLRGVLTNDPLRAVQAMPAVAAGDDFRSEFAIRGAGLSHMNFVFEGIATTFLLHTVQQVHDSGSVAMVNGDALDEIVVSSGSYPQRHGNRLGPEIGFRLREGSRDRMHTRASVSAIDASVVSEGPTGNTKRGAWLVSGRKSYLDMIVDRLYPEQNISFGFADAQAKLTYDINRRNQIAFTAAAGRSHLERRPDALGAGNLRDADNRSELGVLTWRWIPAARVVFEQRAAVIDNAYTNVSRDGAELDGGTRQELVYRADASVQLRGGALIESGGEVRRAAQNAREQRLSAGRLQSRESFDAAAVDTSAYVQVRLVPTRGASMIPGLRVDRRSLTETTTVSPWMQSLWPIAGSLALRASGGLHYQEPEFAAVLGQRGWRSLTPERAIHVDVGIEELIGRTARWQVVLYDREDRDLVVLPDAENRIVSNAFVAASLTSRYRNGLDGHSRGIEWLIQRQTPNGFSGWASYALAFTRYRNRTTGEAFWGDYDQRHTINLYGNYRRSDRVSFSARFRAGSNFPAAGYWTERNGVDYVSTERNTLRIPAYSRLDVRMNRTFTWNERRLTLFLEGINVLNQNNVRVQVPSINRRTFEASGLFESMVPVIPSVGVLIEF